jgi:hypothetical protein
VSKLRENNKAVIGVGVKNSTSDLLIANCDEFIYYDDLVARERTVKKTAPARDKKRADQGKKAKDAAVDDQMDEAFALVVGTYEALLQERGEEVPIWGSMIKQTLKRQQPGFNESYYGFKSFGELLEEAEKHGQLKLQRDEKSGGFIVKGG